MDGQTFDGTQHDTRGERNNNPGNIDYLPHLLYHGEVGIEIVPEGEHYPPRFGRFDTPVNGIRAIDMDLLAYFKHHGLNTIDGIINRWAPGSENDTKAYIADVTCGVFNLHPTKTPAAVIAEYSKKPLTFDTSTLVRLSQSIIRHENGRCLYTNSTLTDAAKLALGVA